MSYSEPNFRSAIIAIPAMPASPKRQSLVREKQHSECGPALGAAGPSLFHGWKEPKLTTVGLYYPVGRCNVSLPKDRLNDVMHSLSKLFHKLSFRVNYQDSPISATCYSMDNVELEVSIFADRAGEGMILEIERKDGDSFSFHEYCPTILGAVSNPGNQNLQACTSVPNRWSQSLFERVEELEQLACSSDEIIQEALEATRNMLSADRYDAHRLGLESLVQLTDPNKSGLSVATAASNCLLFPRTTLQQQMSRGILESALGSNNFSDLALVVVAQTFQAATAGRDEQMAHMTGFFGTTKSSGNHYLVDCLLNKVNEMRSQPHRAYYAIISLAALCGCIPSLRSYVNKRQEILQEAQMFGDSCHLALATVSHQLLFFVQA